MSKNKLIITDIDETILNFTDKFQHWMSTKGYHLNYRLRNTNYIQGDYGLTPEQTVELIHEFSDDYEWFGSLSPEPDALHVLPQLKKLGFEFVGITSCSTTGNSIPNRIRNLKEVFGFEWLDVHCLGFYAKKKDYLMKYPPAVWVEDRDYHAFEGLRAGHRSFLIARDYNTGDSIPNTTERVSDWHEIANIILNDEEKKRLREGL